MCLAENRVKLLCSSVWVMKVTGRPDSRISSHPDWDTNEDNKSFRFYVLVVNPNLVLLYSCRMKKPCSTEHRAAMFSLHTAHLPGNPWLVFSRRVSWAVSRFSCKSCRSFRWFSHTCKTHIKRIMCIYLFTFQTIRWKLSNTLSHSETFVYCLLWNM